MGTPPFVNQREPVQAFCSALDGDPRTIMTVTAPGGKGKSRLVSRCIEESKNRGVDHVVVDFRYSSHYSSSDVVDEIRRCLGKFQFAEYQELFQERLREARPSIVLKENTFANTIIGDIIADVDPDTRRLIKNALGAAFLRGLEDVAKENLVVLFFDTYEKASEDVQKWLHGPFFRTIRNLSKVVVVIAGRDVPRLDHAYWANRKRDFFLYDLSLTDWYEYAKLSGALTQIPEALLQKYYDAYHGDPQAMRMLCDPFLV